MARVIGCIFFVSGLITLVQTIIGDRLPIIQVSAPAASSIMSRERERAPAVPASYVVRESGHRVFLVL